MTKRATRHGCSVLPFVAVLLWSCGAHTPLIDDDDAAAEPDGDGDTWESLGVCPEPICP